MRSVYRRFALFAVFLAAFAAVLLCVAHAHRFVPTYAVHQEASASEPAAFSTESAAEKVNINLATQAELEALPGVGPVLAARILAYRDEVGAFYDVGELRRVEGIGDKTLQNLLPYICT